MARIGHGQRITTAELNDARRMAVDINRRFGFEAVKPPELNRFDYLFPDLQKPAAKALLDETVATVDSLKALGSTMHDEEGGVDSTIPAIFTYFGQFVDHDITLEADSANLDDINDPGLKPAPLAAVRELKNARSPGLDLDSVYGSPAERDGDKMKLGVVSAFGQRPPGKDDFNDLHRRPRSDDKTIDREALIGDARNDENLVIAQLQVAFLRAHNALIDKGMTFESARSAMRQHYQWIVLDDFLPRICDPKIVKAVVKKNKVFDPKPGQFFMPLEFTVAAYRFGHSMIRATYDHNINFPDATLLQLFTFTALSGDISPSPGPGGLDSLPHNWIIQWDRFVDGAGLKNRARAIDTKLVDPLFALRDIVGNQEPGVFASLATRNLLRGYLLRMPTGQAVAKKLGISPLSASAVLAASTKGTQRTVLKESGFHKKTPLWFYVLAEAAHTKKGRLGPVGSTLVAEVLVALVRRSEGSILHPNQKGWKPTIGKKKGIFKLDDLLRLGGVL